MIKARLLKLLEAGKVFAIPCKAECFWRVSEVVNVNEKFWLGKLHSVADLFSRIETFPLKIKFICIYEYN